MTLFTTTHISLSLVEKKIITDDDSPVFFLVLRYSQLLLHCHFRAFTFPFIAPAITFSLCTINHGLHSSTALSCHCHQLYVCHHLQKFFVNFQFKPFFIHCTKQKPRHSPHHNFIEFIITRPDILTFFILQQVLVWLFSILSNKRRLKACKFILLYFPPNCEVFITKSQPKLHS